MNAARLNGFDQSAGPLADRLFDELAPRLEQIPQLSPEDVGSLLPFGFGELIEIDGRPKWRWSARAAWESGPVRVDFFGRYVGSVFDPGVTQDQTQEFFKVDDWFTFNLGFRYRIETDNALDGTSIRFAVNNVTNEAPPIAEESFGFYGSLHSARGRVFSIDIRKNF